MQKISCQKELEELQSGIRVRTSASPWLSKFQLQSCQTSTRASESYTYLCQRAAARPRDPKPICQRGIALGMRLINTDTLEVETFLESDNSASFVWRETDNAPGINVPKYAILSHTWETEEVTFQEMTGERSSIEDKAGFRKIKESCSLARFDGHGYIWVDTCCIDKSSSSELSEAINSMFKWYKNSAICYVYLSDVAEYTVRLNAGIVDEAGNYRFYPRWYKRGWTLQELIAAKDVVFYDSKWKHLGTKADHKALISEHTGIDLYALGGGDLQKLTIARRMSWIRNRLTTRSEDMAYCLLGIFDINMPLLYGEGSKAFLRLEAEIMKTSDDQSLFAWRDHDSMEYYREDYGERYERQGLLAPSPSYFQASGSVAFFHSERAGRSTSVTTNQGIQVQLLMCQDTSYQSGQVYLAVLDCQIGNIPGVFAGIRLKQLGPGGSQFARVDIPQLLQFARFDREGNIELDGFDPTVKIEQLLELKFKTSHHNWTPRSIFIRQDPQSPLLPGFWLIPTKPFAHNTFTVKNAYPEEDWDPVTRILQPSVVDLRTSKVGALQLRSEGVDFELILGITRSDTDIRPWCKIRPFSLSYQSPLEHLMSSLTIADDVTDGNTEHREHANVMDSPTMPDIDGGKSFQDSRVITSTRVYYWGTSVNKAEIIVTVEPRQVSGRKMFIVAIAGKRIVVDA